MGELLDRVYQKELLTALADAYPSALQSRDIPDRGDNSLCVNMKYLEEHRLVEASWFNPMSGGPHLGAAAITAIGLDFLQDDGGLGAILGVVTVRFDDETLRALMVSQVESSAGNPDLKKKVVDAIKEMPEEAVKTAGERLIKKGLDNTPNLLTYLSDLLF